MDKRDIPIFLFSMDAPLPVFIDKHYQVPDRLVQTWRRTVQTWRVGRKKRGA